MQDGMNKSIVLMGCKHCGKSTQGRLLAQKYGVDFFDTDDVLASLKGKDARTYYREKGLAGFILAEEEACREVIKTASNHKVVIATGGGICDNPPALSVLRECGIFVFLKLDINLSVSRIMDKIEQNELGTFKNVPAYVLNENPTSLDQIKEILMRKFTARYQQYQTIADIVVDIKNAPIEENFQTLLGALTM